MARNRVLGPRLPARNLDWRCAEPGAIIGPVLITFGMEPVAALALLLGLWTVTTISDTIASVILALHLAPAVFSRLAAILVVHLGASRGDSSYRLSS